MGADKLTESTKMTTNISAKIVCLSSKVWYFDEKRLHWASVVRVCELGMAAGALDIGLKMEEIKKG